MYFYLLNAVTFPKYIECKYVLRYIYEPIFTYRYASIFKGKVRRSMPVFTYELITPTT